MMKTFEFTFKYASDEFDVGNAALIAETKEEALSALFEHLETDHIEVLNIEEMN